MTHIGIDIEQFVTDPYGSGIQRVLQYLAKEWPQDMATADFVVPFRGEFLLLPPGKAADLIGLAFDVHVTGGLRESIANRVGELADEFPSVKLGTLLSMFDRWLLPEVSYLPDVLHRFELFGRCLPTLMIGYDALPMTEPLNYRFIPGRGSHVSEYFRLLAKADAVVCISDYSRESILSRLRRDRSLVTKVAHPGGDHVAIKSGRERRSSDPVKFVRLGTLENRKRPREILAAITALWSSGVQAEITFIGKPSASDESINDCLRDAVKQGIGVIWVQGADDSQVQDIISESEGFLSIGVEGYGIPVLEAIRLGTPVAYQGIQPAAELMDGRGATRIFGESVVELTQSIAELAESPPRDVDSESVPTWSNFAINVVHAANE